MGLRCSVLGHDYGDPEVEREREERGSELVVSVTEFQECTRCGDTIVISENTEVTPSEPTSASAGPDEEVTDEPAETTTAVDDGSEPEGFDPDVDDAEILDDEPEGTDRDHGEWPEAADVHDDEEASDPAAWPEAEGEDEGYDAVSSQGAAEVEFGGGLTPQADLSDEEGETIEATEASQSSAWVGAADDEAAEETGFARAERTPSDDPPDEDLDTELYCPNCEASEQGGRPSLRAGDICPECHAGYLAERERSRNP